MAYLIKVAVEFVGPRTISVINYRTGQILVEENETLQLDSFAICQKYMDRFGADLVAIVPHEDGYIFALQKEE